METITTHPFRSEQARAAYLAHYEAAAKNWPVPAEERTIETAYGPTFVRISGPAEGQPLILLPGAGCCSLAWALNIKDLSAHYRTYAVDSLIHTGCLGKSVYTRPVTGAVDAAAWLDELFDGLGLDSGINLVGASYSGWLASQYALHAPDRLNKLVLVAPAGTILPFSENYLQQSMALYINPARETYINFFRWNFKDLAQKAPQFIETLADDILLSVGCFVDPNPAELPTLTAMSDTELQSINVPTLVLIGENELLYATEEAIQRLDQVAPQIQKTIIPNAGHDLLLVQTEMVDQKILDFLA